MRLLDVFQHRTTLKEWNFGTCSGDPAQPQHLKLNQKMWQRHQLKGKENTEQGTTNQNEHNVNSGEPTLPMEKLEQVIQLFQFYAVYYSKTYYIGKPTAIQDGLFVFTFLHKMGTREFVWPNREDTDNISRDRIFGGPIPLIG